MIADRGAADGDENVGIACRRDMLIETGERIPGNAERPHQGIGNVPLTDNAKTVNPAKGRVNCRKRLGGLIRHYHRSAA